ncbi:asparagine synthase-related protein [Azoarcus sp. TTM-91]|uniref:asparagine synthetase B family protein n=1 Tax=Azoarcus sp. TTM-91 TaxID=2691581 RepID=UPI002006DF2A|nr:asparagine synthase-related protein [Azoarcus sp. TTM-91]
MITTESKEARLPATIAGMLSRSAPPQYPTPAEGLAITELGHGFLGHAAGAAALSRDGEAACLAWGTPRFDDAALQQLAEQQGIAAAWLAAFRTHGAQAAAHVGGRFAVALADGQTLHLAVDRFGTYPLCYAADTERCAFANRAEAVPGERREVDPQAIFDYLYFHVIPAPRTIFQGVQRLPAAHVLSWRGGVQEVVPYWTPRFAPDPHRDLEASKAEFLDIVERSVAREAAHGTIGAFLSGGTDSSTVSGMLCKVFGKPAQTYSIGFDASGYDEMEYARLASRHFGTEHHEYYVTPDDLLEAIPKVAAHYDQPFGNSSGAPAWVCVRRAHADGITHMLAGDGGDELFGGNARYAKQKVFGLYERVPGLVRRGLLEPVLGLPGMGGMTLTRKAASYVEQAKVPLPDRLDMYNLLLRLGFDTVFEPSFLSRVATDAPLQAQRRTWERSAGASLLDRMLAFDWKYTLADNDLPKVIGTADLAGVSVSFPLLADELIAFSLTLPEEWKLRGQTLRWFFKEALRGFLPDEIISKKKHGFGLPFGVWAGRHDGLRELTRDALNGLKQRGIVQPAFIDDLVGRLLPSHPGYYGEMVWILVVLELWLRAHAPEYGL